MNPIEFEGLHRDLTRPSFATLCEETARRHGIDEEGLIRDRTPGDPPTAADVAAVIQWMLLGRDTPSNRPASSYGAKHWAEDWHTALSGHRYIPNGAAIVALALLHPGWRPGRDDGLNCKWRALTEPLGAYRHLRGLIDDCEKGPRGGAAERPSAQTGAISL